MSGSREMDLTHYLVNPSLLFILKDKPMMADYSSPSWNAIVFLMDQLIILTVKSQKVLTQTTSLIVR